MDLCARHFTVPRGFSPEDSGVDPVARGAGGLAAVALILALLAPMQGAAGPAGAIVEVSVNGGMYVVGRGGVILYWGPSAFEAFRVAIAEAARGSGLIVVHPGVYHVHGVGRTPGMYKFGVGVWINESGVAITGYGAVLVLHGDAAVVLGCAHTRVYDVAIKGLTIYAGDAEYDFTHGAVVVCNAERFAVEEVALHSPPVHGIQVLLNSRYGRVSGNIVVGARLQAVSIDGADGVVVSGNIIVNATTGINLQVNGDVKALGLEGVPEFNTIQGNTIAGVAYGIVVSGGSFNVIVGNAIRVDPDASPETTGIRVQLYRHASGEVWAPAHNVVTGNTLAGPRYALWVTGLEDEPAVGNTFTSNACKAYYALLARHAHDTIFADNACQAPGGTKIGPGVEGGVIQSIEPDVFVPTLPKPGTASQPRLMAI